MSSATDVLVLGSGSAAFAAALKAAAGGLSVRIVEKSGFLGGTSAMSGAGTWVPLSRQAEAAGIADTPDRVLTYIHAVAPPGWAETEAPLWRAFVAAAPEMLAFLEEASPLRFVLENDPDPARTAPGALAEGRMVSPKPLRAALAGPFRGRIRPSTLPQLFTYGEMRANDVYHHPVRASLKLAPRLLWRLLTGQRTKGASLITGMLRGCLDRGVRVDLDTRAVSLLQDDTGRVTGVVLEKDGVREEARARRGVVIATGGFEWDPERRARHFPGPFDYIASPRSNSGDGHRMAEAAGAALAHMDQGNLNPAIPTRYEGRLHGLGTFHHREPDAIVVDRTGRRFVNEFSPDVSEAVDARSPDTGWPLHLPAWVITSTRVLRRAPILTLYGRHDPRWMVRARTLADLADRIRLPADILAETVARFDAAAAAGTDADFGRSVAAGTLAPIGRGPYLAMPFNRSFLATKGGPRTDDHARVLRPDGSVIPGLYCAGVAMANPFGTRAYGSGTTIGPNLTWGYIAARTILETGAP